MSTKRELRDAREGPVEPLDFRRPGPRVLALGALLGAAIGLARAPQEAQRVVEDWKSLWPAVALASLALGAVCAAVVGWARRRGGEALAAWLLVFVAPTAAAVGAVGASATRFAAVTLGLAALGWMLHSTHRGSAPRAALWLSLACAVSVHTLAPGTGSSLAFLAVAACCGAGLVSEHREATLRRFLTRRATSGRGEFARNAPHAPPTRSMLAGMLVAALAWMLTGFGQRAYTRALDAARLERNEAAQPRDPLKQSAQSAMRQWLTSVSMGSSDAQRSDEILATVALRDGRTGEAFQPARPPYFPVTTLDALNGDRLESSGLDGVAKLRDADDGEEDGWIELRRPASRAPLTTATVTQFAQSTARGGWLPLLRLEPLHAIRIDEVRRLGDGALLLEAPGERAEYALVAASREPTLSPGESARARHPEARFLDLPRDDAAFERIAREARRVAADRESDAERVLAVVAHFRDGFTYSEEGTGAEGLEGLARLLERRSGYCASIAAAAVVMLRSLDLPARAVAGFLGSEYDLERDEYVLRQRHGHAWIEVHFEGLGWVRLEPTPADRRAPTPGAEREAGALSRWGSALRNDVGALFSGEEQAPSVGEVVARLAEGPDALLTSARRREPLAVGLVLAIVLASVVTLFRVFRRAVRGVQVARSSAGRALAFEQRLIEALRGRGARVSASQTLREIVRSADARVAPSLMQRLERAVRSLYAARFGGVELAADVRGEVEDLIRELRAEPANTAN